MEESRSTLWAIGNIKYHNMLCQLTCFGIDLFSQFINRIIKLFYFWTGWNKIETNFKILKKVLEINKFHLIINHFHNNAPSPKYVS